MKLLTGERNRSPHIPKMMEVIQGYWLRIGVKADLVPVELTLFYRGINALYEPMIGQAAPWGTQASPITPARLRTGFHSTGGMALLGKARPDIDKLLDEARSEMNEAKRRQMTARVIKETVETYTSNPLTSLPELDAVGPRVDFDIPPEIFGFISPLLDRAKHKQP
ncbi:MAG: hypothetical protein HW402_757 [Dehalococcoidales bacterium]|nr:hypothetical protein [Dehalococcoidales bacterium]